MLKGWCDVVRGSLLLKLGRGGGGGGGWDDNEPMLVTLFTGNGGGGGGGGKSVTEGGRVEGWTLCFAETSCC